MKERILKKIKKISKKGLNILLIIEMFMTSVGFPTIVLASGNTRLVIDAFSGSNGVSHNTGDEQLDFYIGEELAGNIKVKVSGESTYIMPTLDNGKYVFNFEDTNAHTVEVEITENSGYSKGNSYEFNLGNSPLFNNSIILDLTAGDSNILLLQFESNQEPVQNNDVANINLQTPNGLTAIIDESNNNQINYKKGDSLVGTAIVKVGEEVMTPTIGLDGNMRFELIEYSESQYIAEVQVTPTRGHSLDKFYHVDGAQENVEQNKLFVTVNNNQTYNVQFNLIDGLGPQEYPIAACFSGINECKLITDDYVVIPSGWSTGTITLKAKIITLEDGTVIPQSLGLTDGVASDLIVHPLLGNLDELNNTVEGKSNNTIVVNDGFETYGRITAHLINDDIGLNKFINIVTEDAIIITIEADMEISGSLGTANINQALVTTENTGDVSVFFGNNLVRLFAAGPNVDSVTSVTGNIIGEANDFGGFDLNLPALSEATNIPVEVTIKLKSNKSIKKTINIVRTAIQLYHTNGNGDDSVYAGYVVNKGYLYDNKNHDDAIFDAYLQVMFYKDDTVVGYKQIKIDDEDLIDNLSENQSGTIEMYDENHRINVYGKATNDLVEGVNKVSVFLTNGPIDFNGDKLPSINFGIGSGLTLEWSAN